MIVTTFDGLKYTVSEEQAKTLANELNRTNPPKYITIQGNLIATSSISGVLLDGTQSLSGGKWKCPQGHIHPPKDTYCGIGKLINAIALPESTETGEEERYRKGRAAADKVKAELSEKLGWGKKVDKRKNLSIE